MKMKRALSWVLLVSMLVSMMSTGVVATDSVEAPQETPAVVETIVEPEVSPEPQPEPAPVVEETPVVPAESQPAPAETPEEIPEATDASEATPAEAPVESDPSAEISEEPAVEEPAQEAPVAEEPAAEEPPAEEPATDEPTAEEPVAEEFAEEESAAEASAQEEPAEEEVIELLPEETTGEDAEILLATDIYKHNFNHLDIRIEENTYTFNKYYIDENGNKVDAGTESIRAYVTKVYSCTINGITYTGTGKQSGWYEFEQDYEYRHDMNRGSTKFTDSTTATFIVDMKLADGTTLSNVTVFFNNAGVRQAAYNCNGYSSNRGFDGLDFRITQGTVSFEVEVEKRDVSVTKVWNDDNNSAGFRPSSVVVNLLADGASTGKSATLSASNNWSYTFEDLSIKDSNGNVISYTVVETEPANYDATITGSATNGYTVTNTYVPDTVTIAGTKVWNDGNNQDGLRPVDITIELYANGVKAHEMDTSAAKGWKWSFTVPKYADGKEIVYTVKEEAVAGYTTAITGSAAAGYTITNSHTPATVAISGSKTWDDANNQDGKRPASITVSLYKDVVQNGVLDGTKVGQSKTVTAASGWTWDFGELPKYENGAEIYYYVVEDAVPGYSTEVNGYDITNHYTPETVTVAGSKTWWDNNNQDGLRPDSITIALYADGVKIDEKTVTEQDGWAGSWTGLPKYKNGTVIVYTVDELNVPDGYIKVVDGYNIRNVHTPEVITVTGEKTWDDNNDQDGLRPDYIEITLMAQVGNANPYEVESDWISRLDNWKWSFNDLPKYSGGVEIKYYIVEQAVAGYETEVTAIDKNNVINITNSHTPEETEVKVSKIWDDENDAAGFQPDEITVRLLADGVYTGKALVLNAYNQWTGTFSNLDKFAAGSEINYTVEEVPVAHYTTTITGDAEAGYTVTNKHVPETVDVKVTKVWDDNNNQDGKRTTSVTVNLLKNGTEIEEVVLDSNNNWTHTFTDLPEYEGGTKNEYTVTEDAVADYTSAITGTVETGFTVTNTHVPERISLKVIKNWVIPEEYGNITLPSEIKVHLMGNGIDLYQYYTENKVDGIDPKNYIVTLTSSNEISENVWEYEWKGLRKYQNGREVVYSVWEEPVRDTHGSVLYVDEYKASAGAITITNTYDPDHTAINVTKIWWDDYDRDGLRPATIQAELKYATVPIDASEQEIDAIRSDPSKFSSIPDSVYSGKRIVTLAAEANKSAGIDFSLWNYFWTDLPAYVTDTLGEPTHRYIYRVEEIVDQTVADNYRISSAYDKTTNLWTITNTYTPKTTQIPVTKVWDDKDDAAGFRPDSITVKLLADGVATGETLILNKGNDWTGKFTGLYVNNAGKPINYTIEEVKVDKYISNITGEASTGFTVTNTHEPEMTEITVTKVWEDANDQDGKRPDTITVDLYADGVSKEMSMTLSEANNWTGSYKDLPVYANGEKIVYTVVEDNVAKLEELGYTSTVGALEDGKVTITNSRTPETIDLSGKKVWDDASNQDGIRPGNLTLDVYADVDGDSVAPIKVREVHLTSASSGTNADEWTWSIAGLPKYFEGKLIKYTVEERAVAGYTTEDTVYSADGYTSTITNTHETAKIKISGTKVWADANNQDGKRPDSIKIELWKDVPGVSADSYVDEATVDSNGEWAFDFGELPLYENSQRIDYFIVEKGVTAATSTLSDYSTVITSTYTDANNDGNPEAKDYTVTNIYTPETVIIAGTKEWVDGNDQDGIRPDSITVRLLADGKEVNSMVIKEDASGNWGGVFTTDKDGNPLPRFRPEGISIVYTLTEDPVEGYTTAIHGYNIVNTHVPATLDISGEKTWDDEDNQDGIRPHNIEITLMGKVEGAQPYEVASEWISGEGDNWKWLFENLPVYQNGKKVEYYIEEADITGYTPNIDTLAVSTDGKNGTINITNSHEPEVIDVSGEKTWDDNNDQDGKRPASITINLLANGEKVDSKTVTAEDGWKWTFKGVDKYADGKEIVYTVTEEAVEGYTPVYNGTNVTNTHTPETTFIVVSKVWEDDDNRDGLRPDSITVTVKADGEAVGDPIVLSEDNSWHKVITELPVYSEGKEIVYTVVENELEDYTGTVSAEENIFTITNTHEIETTEISVKKLWKDNEDADGIRPESVKIQLLADGEKVGEAVEVKDTYTWTELPVNEDGEEIVYTVEEIDVADGYEPKYSDLKAGVITITNVHEQETTDIKVTKTWVDNNDAKKARPKSITVQLYANGVEYGAATTITADMKWEYTFEDLPANKGGEPIKYTVKEAGVKHYIAKYTVGDNNVLVIKNTYTDIPLTGDTINMLLWSFIGGSAMLSLGGVSVMAKRKKLVK